MLNGVMEYQIKARVEELFSMWTQQGLSLPMLAQPPISASTLKPLYLQRMPLWHGVLALLLELMLEQVQVKIQVHQSGMPEIILT